MEEVASEIISSDLKLKKMNTLKKVVAWFVFSSSDPQRIALTVKGLLAGLTVWVLWWGGLFGYKFDAEQLGRIPELISQIVQFALTLFAMIATVIGVFRKIYTTTAGTNKVINN